ncbi:hypothetical protein L293_3621 [Acinetobacter gyllenbergii CIP 110306 = MTCC 11365]|nr:hypothetical protein L293_3621 [Acinetobacter gyllenbergii CIP 110306 = MTCC 11365]
MQCAPAGTLRSLIVLFSMVFVQLVAKLRLLHEKSVTAMMSFPFLFIWLSNFCRLIIAQNLNLNEF